MKRLFKLLIFLTLLSSLTGCYKYVYVPVAVCPEPIFPVRPVLQTKVTEGLRYDTDSILKAIIVDITNLKSYSEQLEVTLGGYKGKSVPVQPNWKMSE